MGLLCSSAFLILHFLLFFSLFRFLFFIFFSLFCFHLLLFFLCFVSHLLFFSLCFVSPLLFFLSVSFSFWYLACKHGSGVHRLMSVAHRRLHYVERCPPPAARAHAQEEGREGGGWWGFQRCKCHVWSLSDALVSIYLSECSTFFSNFARQHKWGPGFVKMDCYHPFIGQQLETIEDLCQCRKDPRTSPCHCGCFRHSPSH